MEFQQDQQIPTFLWRNLPTAVLPSPSMSRWLIFLLLVSANAYASPPDEVERMLAEVERLARCRGACKLTLEVLSGNAPAWRLYQRIGFAAYQLDPALGSARFLQKWLD